MLKQIARWMIKWEILWLLLLSPFLFFPTPQRTLTLLFIPLLWVLRKVASARYLPRTPLDWPLLLLLIMVAVSVWASFDLLLSLPKVTGVLLGIAFYYALVAHVERHQSIWLPLLLLITVSGALSGLSLLGTNWADKISSFERITAWLPMIIQGLPGSPPKGFNPNSVAGALLFVFPLLLVLFFKSEEVLIPPFSAKHTYPAVQDKYVRLILLLALIVIGGTLLLTQSRGGYLGMLVGIGTVLFLPRPRLLSFTIIAILISLGLFLLISFLFGEPDLFNSIEVGSSLLILLQGRIEIWSRALYAIQDVPFTGMGMGTFRHVVPMIYPMFTLSPTSDIGHAHNHLLATGVDLGIPGLMAYFALWLGAGAMCWRLLYASGKDFHQVHLLALGLASGMMAHFTWAMTDANVLGSKAGFVFWLALATIASLHHLATSRFIS